MSDHERRCHHGRVDESSTDLPHRLLLVEDDTELSGMLVRLLSTDGYAIDLARDGQQGLRMGLSHRYAIAVVDRKLPVMDGLDLVVRLRRRSVATRVLMLTALGSLADRVHGLDAGADDYLSKPFEVAELRARVRALSRRSYEPVDSIPLGAGSLEIAQRTVRLPDGAEVALTAREFDLIRLLALRPLWVHSRHQLRRQVFQEAASESIVDTYVHYLRRKLGRAVVRTVHGLGYRIGSL
jgi:two-component system response regulator QseB